MHLEPGGGGGGMSHWGLYIIRVNHFLKSTLNEDEEMVPTALWTLHRACAPGYRSQISYPFRRLSADLSGVSVNLIPFFHISLFLIPLTRYARYAPGGEIDTLFTRFYWRGWCTGPNETCPPGSWDIAIQSTCYVQFFGLNENFKIDIKQLCPILHISSVHKLCTSNVVNSIKFVMHTCT